MAVKRVRRERPGRVRAIAMMLLVALAVTQWPASAHAQLQQQLKEARENAAAAAAEADAARERARAARLDADEAAGELDHAVHELEDIEARQRVFEGRAALAEEQLDALRGSVEDVAVRRYVAAGEENPITIDADLHRHVRATTLFRFVLLGGDEDIDEFRVVDEELRLVLAELDGLALRQEAAIVELDDRNAELARILGIMQEELDLAEAKEAEFQREVSRLEAEERRRLEEERRRRLEEQRRRAAEEAQRRAEEEAREAARRAAEAPTTTAAPGSGAPSAPPAPAPVIRGDGFLCPIGGATSFSDTWGAARSGGRSHKGVDMFATRGVPVVASVSGTVTFRNSGLGGKAYWLNGDDGHRYYGAHLDSFGQSGYVTAGTVIGTVGNTGNARFSSPHLHFEIHPNGGAAVNPTPTVRAACG